MNSKLSMMIVYKTTNLINNKIYVGKDSHSNPKYLGSGVLLKQAFKKYGRENFIKEILEVCETPKQLDEREIFWIAELQATKREIGYNLAQGGTGGKTRETPWNKGISPSAETREKLRQKSLGGKGNTIPHIPWNKGLKIDVLTPETREIIREKNLGQKRSVETKLKMSVASKGKPKSEEHKAKLSVVNKGKKLSALTKTKMSEARKGVPQKQIQCPHCLLFGGTTLYRWHFDSCKFKEQD
jgi:group I intron endonuclease